MNDFTRYKTIIGFQKFPSYLSDMKYRFPYQDNHHILGSTLGKKHTDALIMPIDSEDPKMNSHFFHIEVVEKHKAEFFQKYLRRSYNYFMGWAENKYNIPDTIIKKYRGNLEPEFINEFIEYVYKLTKKK